MSARPSLGPEVLTLEVLAPWRARLSHLDGVAAPVVVACSGGPDSLALLALAVDAGLDPIAVHVDHGLRAGSDREADLVADAAARLGARVHRERVTVASGPNLEARARDARYTALERARIALGASAVLVGHTADDQAETVLLNLLRGSATAGLGGMPGRRDQIVRPLLGLRRTDTAEVCTRLGLAPLDDPMNADPAFLRVRLRHEVIPALELAAGRDLVAVLARQADVLRAESDFLDGLARAAWPLGDGTAPAAPLAAMPVVLARRAVRCWLGPPPPSFDEVERVLAVARGETRATELAGGRRVRRSRGQLHADGEGSSA
ncbi:MAG TPA: tRNA lysidine(34) synthetase TilS [Acidimicrobiia bacterium]|nr:tRNA lysidine(34) synthetase TilS [Acidimicrobiia bacterium]